MLSKLFENNGDLPSFIDTVDDFPHLKIVRLKGNLDASSVSEFQRYLRKVGGAKKVLNKSVVLDLKDVGRLDSAAIAELLNVFASLKAAKHRLGLMNVPECLSDMVEILKLRGIFLIFESEKRAFQKILEWAEEWG